MAGVKRPWSSAFSGEDSAAALPRPPEQPILSSSTHLDVSEHDPARVICYGMLCDVKAEFLDAFEANNTCGETIRKDNELYHPLKIRIRRHHILQTIAGTDVAFLNMKLSQILRLLGDEIQCHPFVTKNEWSVQVDHFKNNTNTQIDIFMNIYGPSSISTQVGKELSKAGLFLQHPILLKKGVKYDNPHYLRISTLRDSQSALLTPVSESPVETFRSPDLITSVLDDLDQQVHLQVAQVNQESMRTSLKSHQREALDFISQREAEITPQPFSLWRLYTDRFGRQYYQHLILGIRRAQLPNENFGGIIADEMGLGKTFTMLSAIYMSRGRGKQRLQGDVLTGPSNTLRCSTAATLVIVPSTLLMENWIEEARRYAIFCIARRAFGTLKLHLNSRHFSAGSLRCAKYYGKDRHKNLKALLDCDVMLTTYATLTSDHRRGTEALSSVHWLRIVLDEAHCIRHQRTRQFYAVSALSADYRWCLTGTPIQNHLDDLGALVQFLRIPMFNQPSAFQANVSKPIEHGKYIGADNLRKLLKAICIRRKTERLNLPEPLQLTEHVDMTGEETAEYSRIGRDCRKEIDDAVSGIRMNKEYHGLFQAILRLRIFCNHGTLTQTTTSSNADETLTLLQQTDQAICHLCSCDVACIGENRESQSAHFTLCSHLLICQGCVEENKSDNDDSDKVICPTCQKTTSVESPSIKEGKFQVQPQIRSGTSSKLEALTKNLMYHPTEKSIVFSCWKKTIRLAGSFLATHGISTAIVDGSMTLSEREAALERFKNNQKVNVLLMTLGTGSVGLNLTVASRIHILEPQWNPLQESQAIGRAIRLGQEKRVTVVRYITRNSVEAYIQFRQSKKLYLAQLGWNSEADESEEAKLRKLADLKSLLSLENGTEAPAVGQDGPVECEMADAP